MTEWVTWLIAAGLLLILEMLTGTFYLLMLAFGLAAGSVAALVGGSLTTQYLAAGLVGVVATACLHKSGFGRRHSVAAARDPNVNLDIGQEVLVDGWTTAGDEARARIMYRGAFWSVRLMPGQDALPGRYVIREVQGSELIVSAKQAAAV